MTAVPPAGASEASIARPAEGADDTAFAAPPRAPDELVVTARSDADGYHLQIAEGADDWAWRPLATVLPEGGGGEPWTGYHCVTGDQRYVVVVVAPRSFSNEPAARDRGGLLYRVSVADGSVAPLAAGVAVKYYNPGCGIDDRVAVVGHEGEDQARTRVRILRVSDGTTQADWSVAGQLSSAVPAAGSPAVVMAARDAALVRIDGEGEHVVAEPNGLPFQVRANSAGGADFLVTRPTGDDDVGVWSIGGPEDEAQRVGTGRLGTTKLFGGRGMTIAVDAEDVEAEGFTTAEAGGGRPIAVSSAGAVVAVEVLAAPGGGVASTEDSSEGHAPASPNATDRPGDRELRRGADGAVFDRPEPAPDGGVAAVPLPVDAIDARATPADGAAALAAPGTPRCAVPRNDLRRQASQPNSARVDWAIQQATRNQLKGSVLTRAASYANMNLSSSYQPSVMFPRNTLRGAASSVAVPPSVIQAVFAQESNWKQATFRALPGVSGNPLINDFYGAGGTLDRIDYAQSDCGYGVSQITTPMTAASSVYSADQKAVAAVDYAGNVAAGIQVLVEKWNQLADAGALANNGDPALLENWYMATWAYNSGFHTADAQGNSGLGWTNNPINADYPPDRPGFLRETYADAEHPNDWPYQERIVGWMESPQLNYKGESQYATPSYQSGATIRLPDRAAFCDDSNRCDPDHIAGSLSFCTNNDVGFERRCWWHEPVTWVTDCAHLCAKGRFTVSSTATEPAGADNYPPNCNALPPAPLDGRASVIVDDATPSLNVEGCTPSGWTSQGQFTYTNGTTADGTPLGVIDWHQLGTGFSGHTWFTKNRAAGDAAHINTGTWTPPAVSGRYNIKAHIPASGASTSTARYVIHRGNGTTTPVVVDQHLHENRWVSLGDFDLQGGAKVVLNNVTAETVGGTTNVAFDAMAFTPVSSAGTLVDVRADAAAIFDSAQPTSAAGSTLNNLILDNPNTSDAEVEDWMLDHIAPILAKPACAPGVRTGNCTPDTVRYVLAVLRNQVTGSTPAVWQGYANADPPSSSPASFLANPHNHKLYNSVGVRYRLVNGQIDPASVTVGFTAQSGVTHMPEFMLGLFQAMLSDYLLPKPDLRYSEENLGTYTHGFSAVDPIASGGDLPGREYRSAITPPSVSGSCVTVHAIGGGMIGWKIALNEGGIAGAFRTWKDRVGDAVEGGLVPAALYDMLDGIYHHWWSNQYSTTIPPRYEGALHRMAPPIWIEQDLKICGNGTVSPHLSPRIATNSFMPDLYLWINGVAVDETGTPRRGPARTGDFSRFTNDPLTNLETPYGTCLIMSSAPDDSAMPVARGGNAWAIQPVVDGKDTGDSVRYCERAVADAYPVDDHGPPS